MAGCSCPREQAHFPLYRLCIAILSLEPSGFLSRNFPLSEPYFHTQRTSPHERVVFGITPCGIPAPRSQSRETATLRCLPPLRGDEVLDLAETTY